jgi:D-3-phosphoglycerate dehydrogenase / 2-oxoglutarate reductase
MYKIQKLNKISPKGLERFPSELYEHATEIVNPDAILVRSADMLTMEIPGSVLAIARAGAGVNNIPIDKCSQKGIAVFNTPGANANAVKELVLLAFILSSRNAYEGISWAKSLAGKGDEVPKAVEKGKSDFTGPEIKGKKLGVIGLGAIGVMVANDAIALGMEVTGYDPYISVEAAWGLSRAVKRSISLDYLVSESDFISLHVPLNDKTKGMINKEKFALMKKGARLINLARGGLVNNADLKSAIQNGTIARYVTDFPDDELLTMDKVIPIPHLGASTPESEENCAYMAVDQLREFLERGNTINSVNFPDCTLIPSGSKRILIANKNIPAIIGKITQILAEHKINIADMLNKSKGDYAYNIIDIDGNVDEAIIKQIKQIKELVMVRVI